MDSHIGSCGCAHVCTHDMSVETEGGVRWRLMRTRVRSGEHGSEELVVGKGGHGLSCGHVSELDIRREPQVKEAMCPINAASGPRLTMENKELEKTNIRKYKFISADP